ncbi:hypothetical protein HME9302_00974 [Alteripontixanthobacter maritimus]|uniref:Putative DnaT-like domain-containing protein n=1 Tax=Alteripontixanthobacter maritimus TaxID=2161824 RepID=A0A369QA42_9SPHN|nr:DnaT-like ssDNA-binding protein [Alteripontixanthobacter maritimus]RDC59779.1 hypothetical protein HME9302_00974 [Alteripontixanthobacter maritimus]
MALTVETGAGIDGASSFITVAEFDAVQADYFPSPINGTQAEKESALRRAWLAMKVMGWSKSFPSFGGTIPADVKVAQGILARAELASPESLQPNITPGQQKILTQVGEIGWTPTGQGGIDAQRSVVTMALDLLKPYLHGNGQTRYLIRA